MRIFLDANICLDLLDTTRSTSAASIAWYMQHKDDSSLLFYFSGDFITTFYYILTERKRVQADKVIAAIDALAAEIEPFYLNHADFQAAKESFFARKADDFEDLMILHSALRAKCDRFLTGDRKLLDLGMLQGMRIEGV